MIDLLRLCRPYYSVPMAFIHALTVCYALGGAMAGEWSGTLLSAISIALVISAGYVLNDVCDRSIDRVNSPLRPLAAGRITVRRAMRFAIVLFVVGLSIATACRWQFLIVLVVVSAGLIVYDLISKRLNIAKQLFVAVLMTSIYPLAIAQASGLTGSRAGSLAFFAAWLFLTSFGYEGHKDIRDAAGDRCTTGRPTWVHQRQALARNVFRLAIVTGAAVLVGPYLAGCGHVYMSIVAVAMLAAVVAFFLPTRRAMAMVYLECVIVGVAATADIVATRV